MDLATIGGIAVGLGVVGVAIFLGGNAAGFIDIPSFLIVFGGGAAAVLIRFPLKGVLQSLYIGGRSALRHKKFTPVEIVSEISELADLMRRNGPLALEEAKISHKFLAKGVQYVADGYEADFIREAMKLDRDQYIGRLSEGQRVFKAIGDAAPAFGMIGTLVGLVQMLGSMDDPSKIGPAMAVAILTTLYGAVVANIVALPIAEKLGAKAEAEEVLQSLIIDGVLQLRDARSPAMIRELLMTYLPEKHREQLAA